MADINIMNRGTYKQGRIEITSTHLIIWWGANSASWPLEGKSPLDIENLIKKHKTRYIPSWEEVTNNGKWSAE